MRKHTDPAFQMMAKAVRARRKALRMNQQELADLAGCGRLFVSELERGKATLRLDVLLTVLRALGLRLHLAPVQPSAPPIPEGDVLEDERVAESRAAEARAIYGAEYLTPSLTVEDALARD